MNQTDVQERIQSFQDNLAAHQGSRYERLTRIVQDVVVAKLLRADRIGESKVTVRLRQLPRGVKQLITQSFELAGFEFVNRDSSLTVFVKQS